MTPEEIKRKIDDITRRSDQLSKKKAALGGQLQEKKEQLAALIQEIRAAGYDPKTLPAEKDRIQKELESDILNYEAELSSAEKALAVFDTPKKS